ncbi:hypothetical protein BT69DRAFT_1319349 [Atractiella rhizophila]|nr:hypothetical protein BT69DRAFT_1319349 [Atractiella rhizophila]
MTTIHHTPPDLLTLYITHPLSASIISALVRDFSLGTHEGYGPMVRLVVSPRKDVLGLTAEELMRKLEAEHPDKTEEEYEEGGKKGKRILSYPFVIADWDTTERGEVIYVNGWLKKDDFEEPEEMFVPGDWEFPILEKARYFIQEVPINYVNFDIGNMSLQEDWPYPYDPLAHLPQPEWRTDWRLEPPEVAYLTVAPGDYDESTDDGATSGLMPKPEKVYRLKKEIADKLNLVSDWRTGWETSKEVAERQGVEWREGMIEISQSWKWEQPEV